MPLPRAVSRTREGLYAPMSAPPTTRPILTYRIIARVLASLADDRHVWNCRWGLVETYKRDTTVYHPALDLFPTVDAAMDAEPLEIDSGSFWVLERGEHAVACFDVRGRVRFRNEQIVDLMPIYRAPSSSLTGRSAPPWGTSSHEPSVSRPPGSDSST